MNAAARITTLTLLALTASAPAMTPEIAPSTPCQILPSDVSVISFGGVLTYKFHARCGPDYTVNNNQVSFDAVGTWRPVTGGVTESMNGVDGDGNFSMYQDTATCPLNPFFLGRVGAHCTPGSKVYPNLPPAIAASIAPPLIPGGLSGELKSTLAGLTLAAIKAENQAPTILEPHEGAAIGGGVRLSLDPGSGSPTKTIRLEWQKLKTTERGQNWTAADVVPSAKSGESTVAAASFDASVARWRVRARAQQSSDASWSEWRSFNRPLPLVVAPNARGIGAEVAVGAHPSPKASPPPSKKP